MMSPTFNYKSNCFFNPCEEIQTISLQTWNTLTFCSYLKKNLNRVKCDKFSWNSYICNIRVIRFMSGFCMRPCVSILFEKMSGNCELKNNVLLWCCRMTVITLLLVVVRNRTFKYCGGIHVMQHESIYIQSNMRWIIRDNRAASNAT